MNIQCDRCKKIYDRVQDTEITFKLYEVGHLEELHICPECSEKLKEFVLQNKELQN